MDIVQAVSGHLCGLLWSSIGINTYDITGKSASEVADYVTQWVTERL